MNITTPVKHDIESRGNIYIDPFSKVINYYGDTQDMEYNPETLVVAIHNSDKNTGFYENTDIIIQYDSVSKLPMVVAERVYRKRYSIFQYSLWKRQWKNKLRASVYTMVEGSAEVWKIRLSDCSYYFDIIYFNEEWFECQKELQIRQQISQLG